MFPETVDSLVSPPVLSVPVWPPPQPITAANHVLAHPRRARIIRTPPGLGLP
ncbi:hypothetical protein [Nannocystis pusilla]|uniref:hypothetical protein n=1 Tax=Nannocystis pusilla TaxID=889268 RepID=UPI003B821CB1